MDGSINYDDVIEQLQHENEILRETIARLRLTSVRLDTFVHAAKVAVSQPYFWLGYATAIGVILLIAAFNSLWR